jgi:hypothetical protein
MSHVFEELEPDEEWADVLLHPLVPPDPLAEAMLGTIRIIAATAVRQAAMRTWFINDLRVVGTHR